VIAHRRALRARPPAVDAIARVGVRGVGAHVCAQCGRIVAEQQVAYLRVRARGSPGRNDRRAVSTSRQKQT
jgi:hypothetical protein